MTYRNLYVKLKLSSPLKQTLPGLHKIVPLVWNRFLKLDTSCNHQATSGLDYLASSLPTDLHQNFSKIFWEFICIIIKSVDVGCFNALTTIPEVKSLRCLNVKNYSFITKFMLNIIYLKLSVNIICSLKYTWYNYNIYFETLSKICLWP